jgi:hypothetical protein
VSPFRQLDLLSADTLSVGSVYFIGLLAGATPKNDINNVTGDLVARMGSLLRCPEKRESMRQNMEINTNANT